MLGSQHMGESQDERATPSCRVSPRYPCWPKTKTSAHQDLGKAPWLPQKRKQAHSVGKRFWVVWGVGILVLGQHMSTHLKSLLKFRDTGIQVISKYQVPDANHHFRRKTWDDVRGCNLQSRNAKSEMKTPMPYLWKEKKNMLIGKHSQHVQLHQHSTNNFPHRPLCQLQVKDNSRHWRNWFFPVDTRNIDSPFSSVMSSAQELIWNFFLRFDWNILLKQQVCRIRGKLENQKTSIHGWWVSDGHGSAKNSKTGWTSYMWIRGQGTASSSWSRRSQRPCQHVPAWCAWVHVQERHHSCAIKPNVFCWWSESSTRCELI